MASPGFWEKQEKRSADGGRAEVSPVGAQTAGRGSPRRGRLDCSDRDGPGGRSFAGEVDKEVTRLERLVDELELRALLNGPHDAAGAIVSFYARDGGTDANDWAEMLMRMYTLWAQKNDYSVELLDRQDNEVAGIQSASIAIRGPMAYGYLKGEAGIHRLVRISPFNAEGKRQTSFAAVDVSPEISDDIDIEIDESDVREDTFRASGAGGQHVNKTSSAIRLTHEPTGIVVQCQNERSQHKNRSTAWKMLRAGWLASKRKNARPKKRRSTRTRLAWGSARRSAIISSTPISA